MKVWQSTPRGVRHAIALGTVAHFGGMRSAATYLACAVIYEVLRWLIERDMERVRRGLSKRYGVRLEQTTEY